MARPRKGVTFDNADYIHWYVRNANQEGRLQHLLQKPDQFDRAFEVFSFLPEVPYCLLTDGDDADKFGGKLGVDPYALDQWVVEFITPKGWQRILSALRQYRHTRKKLKKSLKLEQEIYWRFSHFARTENISLDEAMKKLLDYYEGDD